MQRIFDFGAAGEIAEIRHRLVAAFGPLTIAPIRDPLSQLVKSLISSRTLDAVSLGAFTQLVAIYPDWAELAAAPPRVIERVIAQVEHAADKARHLSATLRRLGETEFTLDFLADRPVPEALGWLETLPGVGRKVSASTLNFSSFRRPAFVVDSHVLRILRRFGLVRPRAVTEAAYYAVMTALPEWDAAALIELHCVLKRLGQTVCRAAEPRCGLCPIRAGCRTAQTAGGVTTNRR